jgi:hypothetical protein
MLTQSVTWTPEKIAERDAHHAWIDQCIKAGLCHMCEKPVADGEPRHGPTGAHWACHRAPLEELDRLIGELNPVEVNTDTHPRMARANGGQLVHFVIPATGTALCGHKPRDTAHHMRQRGKWHYWKLDAVVPGHMKQCEKCKSRALVKYPPLEDEPKKEEG